MLPASYVLTLAFDAFCLEGKSAIDLHTHTFERHRLDMVVFLDAIGECLRRTFVAGVVDGDVTSFGGEPLADHGSEASSITHSQ